ncbi:hypothetical protein EE612_039852 [Oryza sativa]|nr:hypothetical protein EE612_039852 [Oryza sativa]
MPFMDGWPDMLAPRPLTPCCSCLAVRCRRRAAAACHVAAACRCCHCIVACRPAVAGHADSC